MFRVLSLAASALFATTLFPAEAGAHRVGFAGHAASGRPLAAPGIHHRFAPAGAFRPRLRLPHAVPAVSFGKPAAAFAKRAPRSHAPRGIHLGLPLATGVSAASASNVLLINYGAPAQAAIPVVATAPDIVQPKGPALRTGVYAARSRGCWSEQVEVDSEAGARTITIIRC